ncbi:hypothetical protein ATI02_4338 [Pseudomonas baetica]|uniref:Uncharacterized protein n=1 Tax=Pseudomonas baetica TaxID=674054 RepID=A0ABX4Q3M1_9PSED|nr:hypothetical protein [Pseudomonas baetica]PKA71360.1 hypothetical protein ATI02_4338 [Pseudomonas baetica]PTC19858.1 hypothetical protein C0J26_07625 [Pseudomonas baetica]
MKAKNKSNTLSAKDVASEMIEALNLDNEYKISLESKKYSKLFIDMDKNLGSVGLEILSLKASVYDLAAGSEEDIKVRASIKDLEQVHQDMLIQKDAILLVTTFISKKLKEIQSVKKQSELLKLLKEFGYDEPAELRAVLQAAEIENDKFN